MTAYKLGVSS